MAKEQTEQILDFLEEKKAKFKLIIHKPIFTAEEGALIRKVPLRLGVKSLIFKLDKNEFKLILVRGDRKADLNTLRKILQMKNIRLASSEEVLHISGCEIGSVHPFGNLMKLDILMDSSILENEFMDFNIGQHTHSCEMKVKDFMGLLNPRVEEFTVSV